MKEIMKMRSIAELNTSSQKNYVKTYTKLILITFSFIQLKNLVMCLDLFAFALSIVRRSIETNATVYRISVDVLSALGIFAATRWHVLVMFVDYGLKLISLYSIGIAYLCAWFAHAIRSGRFLQPILMHAMYPVGFLQWLV